ncbi:lamin tail domain-containing protein [Herbidospora mongoliensis]|uniref:lamin tail domain-containing protein n=1 Tax=Herbidospora mongoliensis TaxID=688067 RepID=UPI00082C6A31|nr:lamin tail domain-containing protein [Herbidospora mongoliensis]
MTYTLLRGNFVIRYPDLPRQGPEPDGDTIKFLPDTPALIEALPRPSGTSPDLNRRGISVRLEAIDTLETHFEETHQRLEWANAARDRLLALLGFTGVEFFDDLPNKVRRADQDSIRGYVLSNGIDANGRLIAFVYGGPTESPDGLPVFLTPETADASANRILLAEGLAYPAYYATLPAELRDHLAGISRAARPSTGLWPHASGDPGRPATVTADTLDETIIWPKLFRRLVPYFAAGHPNFDQFDAWLRADPVHRDDALWLIEKQELGNLHDVVRASGNTIELTAWPEDFVIAPDPATGPTTPSGVLTGDLLIVAALPNPVGADAGAEKITLLNVTPDPLKLDGWHLRDGSGNKTPLSGAVEAGTVKVVNVSWLNNDGDSIMIVDPKGVVIDTVTYKADKVRNGRTIAFGR